jgi:hypothetical protein
MKKTRTSLLALLFIGTGTANAQTEKQIQPPPPPPLPPKVEITKYIPPANLTTDFIKRNPFISHIEWYNPDSTIVNLKDGKTETYNLEDENEKKAFMDKYGMPPIPLPPPPPNIMDEKIRIEPPPPPPPAPIKPKKTT